MPKDKSRSKLHHKDNLNEILSTLSKTHKAKVKKIKAEKSKLEDIDSQLQVKKCDFEYMTPEYKNIVTPEKVVILLPKELPEKYVVLITDKPVSKIYEDILEFITTRKYKIANEHADRCIFDLETRKDKFMKMESESISLYQTSLVNILIAFYKLIQAAIYAMEHFKDAEELIRFSIVNFRDSKIINICKTNLALLSYNMAAILYLMKQNEECLHVIRKLIETITNEFSFVDDEVVHRIFLLKSYCHINNDNTLANHAAKMAIDLSKASQIDPQFNCLVVHLESQMLQISSFDDRDEGESVANSNTEDDIILPTRNKENNLNYSLNIIENSPKAKKITNQSLKKISNGINKNLLNPELDSNDIFMSCKSLNFKNDDLLSPTMTKSKSIVGGVLGRKLQNSKPKIDSRRKRSVQIRRDQLIIELPDKHKKKGK